MSHGDIVSEFYRKLSLTEKDKHLAEMQEIYERFKSRRFTIHDEISKFMKGKVVIPQFSEIMNEFAVEKLKNRINIIATRKEKPHSKPRKKKQKNPKKPRKLRKRLRILYEKLIKKVPNKIICKKHNTTSS